MAAVPNRRTGMILYSAENDVQCHRARIVLAEKDISVDVLNVNANGFHEDLHDINPYGSVPTLIDRDLALYDAGIIVEYLDERFPHPPLMPVDPVSRAKSRLFLYRIESDWYSLLPQLESGDSKEVKKAGKMLQDSIVKSNDVFAAMPFFLSEEFSLVDCSIAPILWRLESYGVELPGQAKAVIDYAERVFARDSFQASLTEIERDLRS
ncbi:MAG: glutathione S-transferase N-terminal domain-containing protein [Gammaproteobacteria bacterium]|nr:glutathione S-transferase N-terminal domain-containing protein [Gammaproteobacteria bacterium]